jgi:uncharacterized phage protein (predicted DNA packaging)
MVVSLEEAKLYLRVDGSEEDALITDFIVSAEEICEGILRFPITEFTTIPETLKQSVFFAVASMYEQRENFQAAPVLETIKRLLFAYRKESW